MSYDSDGTTKVLYEPKTDYEIDRIEVMVDKSNHFIDKAQVFSNVALHATKSSILFFLVFCEEGFKISDDSG
jgi:hypothetical protein